VSVHPAPVLDQLRPQTPAFATAANAARAVPGAANPYAITSPPIAAPASKPIYLQIHCSSRVREAGLLGPCRSFCEGALRPRRRESLALPPAARGLLATGPRIDE
jgi:hypothetical protein